MTKLGENNVFFLPYLMGERSPHNNPNARGTFIGMTMDTTRADMTQAVLEGVAFAIRDSFEVAKSLGIKIETHQDLWRWCKEPAVEEDHCKRSGHQSRCNRERRRTGTMAARCWQLLHAESIASVEEACC